MSRTTRKQSDLIINLWGRSGDLKPALRRLADRRGIGHITPDDEKYLLRVLRDALEETHTVEWAHAEINRLNKKLGWDQKTNPATARQLNFLRDLEIAVLGEERVSSLERVTYAEADAQIKLLSRMRKEGIRADDISEGRSDEETSDDESGNALEH